MLVVMGAASHGPAHRSSSRTGHHRLHGRHRRRDRDPARPGLPGAPGRGQPSTTSTACARWRAGAAHRQRLGCGRKSARSRWCSCSRGPASRPACRHRWWRWRSPPKSRPRVVRRVRCRLRGGDDRRPLPDHRSRGQVVAGIEAASLAGLALVECRERAAPAGPLVRAGARALPRVCAIAMLGAIRSLLSRPWWPSGMTGPQARPGRGAGARRASAAWWRPFVRRLRGHRGLARTATNVPGRARAPPRVRRALALRPGRAAAAARRSLGFLPVALDGGAARCWWPGT